MAQVRLPPAAMLTNRPPPETGTGALEDVVSPVPSCPWLLAPQQYASPAASMPQACDQPAVTWVSERPPLTRDGREVVRLSPVPSWPASLSPQHNGLPLWASAQVNPEPAVMATKAESLPTTCGVQLMVPESEPAAG